MVIIIVNFKLILFLYLYSDCSIVLTSEDDNYGAVANHQEKEINLELIWNLLSKNYEMVEGAQLSNSFVILLSLLNSKDPLTTNQISKLISRNSQGEIYKIREH